MYKILIALLVALALLTGFDLYMRAHFAADAKRLHEANKQPTPAVDSEIDAAQYKAILITVYMVEEMRVPIALALDSGSKITQSEYVELERVYTAVLNARLESQIETQLKEPGHET